MAGMPLSDIEALTIKEIEQYSKAFEIIRNEELSNLAMAIRVAVWGEKNDFSKFIDSLSIKQIPKVKKKDFEIELYEEVEE